MCSGLDSARLTQLQQPQQRLPRLDARSVLQGCREVILVHGTAEYRLKLTSSGKLILTK